MAPDITRDPNFSLEDVRKTAQDEPEAPKKELDLEDGVFVIRPAGRLDTVTSAELKERIDAFDHAGHDIELDFENVEYISSAGLRLLVALQKQARAEERTMTIKNINAVVKEVFRISGFNKAFNVV